MAISQFTLESLKTLDGGKAYEAFQLHLKRAACDCMDRPGDDSPRTVALKVQLVPVRDQEGECDEVHAQIFSESKVPVHRTKQYSFGIRKNGILTVNDESPDSIKQKTLGFDKPGQGDIDE